MVYNFREKELYCYENTTTGEIRWEYPEVEQPPTEENNVLDDDEMDISTTPPPNPDDGSSAAFYQSNGITQFFVCIRNIQLKKFIPEFNAAPPPPKWTTESAEASKIVINSLNTRL